MLGKLKSVLGIEGVKVEIRVHEPVSLKSKILSGELAFRSLSEQTIKSAKISLQESYKKGRGQSKTIEVFDLGSLELEINKNIEKDGALMVPFELSYLFAHSDMESFGDKNFITDKLVKLAYVFKNVKSDFTLLVEAKIKGNPFGTSTKKIIETK